MKRLSAFLITLCLCACVPLCLCIPPAHALDTLTAANVAPVATQSTNKVIVTWAATCTAGGAATATFNAALLLKLKDYYLISVCALPTPAGTAPSAAYSITALTAGGFDVLEGVWASAGSATLEVCKQPYWAVSENITLTITGGGNAATITVKALFAK